MSRIYPCVYCTDDLHCTKYTDDNYESWCVLGPCRDETPSNADRIRSMSDEELAVWLYWEADGSGKTKDQWLDWLREEYKNES